MTKTKEKTEFGDFQTPCGLARQVCETLARHGIRPTSILEPTSGTGTFLLAGFEQFPSAQTGLGLEINRKYVNAARATIRKRSYSNRIKIIHGDFFQTDWPAVLETLPDPLLVIGNPPWVTNAALGALGSTNLPQKWNFQKRSGFDAITGKSNFDISEWMLIHLLDWLDTRKAALAMLCKTAVARKSLLHAWKKNGSISQIGIFDIDAPECFDAAVDACLLLCKLSPKGHTKDALVYSRLDTPTSHARIGYRENELLADIGAYNRWKHLATKENQLYRWRSGIKHDCTKVMEFRREGNSYRNGLEEVVDLEDTYLFPMLKSSELANGDTKSPKRWMLVTQHTVGEDTSQIKSIAPKTWNYLVAHRDKLDKRASSIYRNRPSFSVFGVGPYSFSPWKVAISGFYKTIAFSEIGPYADKPIVLDDTCYFLPCETKRQADYIASLLNSDISTSFFEAFIFWDAKRPITVDILRRLDFLALATEKGSESTMRRYLRAAFKHQGLSRALPKQQKLFSGAE